MWNERNLTEKEDGGQTAQVIRIRYSKKNLSTRSCFTVRPEAGGGQIDVLNGETLLTTDMEKNEMV